MSVLEMSLLKNKGVNALADCVESVNIHDEYKIYFTLDQIPLLY